MRKRVASKGADALRLDEGVVDDGGDDGALVPDVDAGGEGAGVAAWFAERLDSGVVDAAFGETAPGEGGAVGASETGALLEQAARRSATRTAAARFIGLNRPPDAVGAQAYLRPTERAAHPTRRWSRSNQPQS
jgi:hypothetical protein